MDTMVEKFNEMIHLAEAKYKTTLDALNRSVEMERNGIIALKDAERRDAIKEAVSRVREELLHMDSHALDTATRDMLRDDDAKKKKQFDDLKRHYNTQMEKLKQRYICELI